MPRRFLNQFKIETHLQGILELSRAIINRVHLTFKLLGFGFFYVHCILVQILLELDWQTGKGTLNGECLNAILVFIYLLWLTVTCSVKASFVIVLTKILYSFSFNVIKSSDHCSNLHMFILSRNLPQRTCYHFIQNANDFLKKLHLASDNEKSQFCNQLSHQWALL